MLYWTAIYRESSIINSVVKQWRYFFTQTMYALYPVNKQLLWTYLLVYFILCVPYMMLKFSFSSLSGTPGIVDFKNLVHQRSINFQLIEGPDSKNHGANMGPTWGPPGSCRPQMGPMLAPWISWMSCEKSPNKYTAAHQYDCIDI